MIDKLRSLEAEGRPIRVALVGAGAMGFGIAWQIGHTPGMRLVAVTDIKPEAAEKAAAASGQPWQRMTAGQAVPAAGPDTVWVTTDPFYILDDAAGLDFDVLVEATNTVGFAADLCLAAIARGAHVVLMNAEVDLALGPLLHHRAQEAGVIVTSDAGDQHGVLMTMIEEIELWAFRIVMAGNIKGFLRRDATAESLAHEAAIRNLDPVMCCAYTDGSKLNVEMALVANATGLVPFVPGMEGPPAADVREVLGLFDWSRYDDLPGGATGVVDYILGAEPGGGVYVVGFCDDPDQMPLLKYYKLGDGPYYLFYRPYHLCHLETTRAIVRAALYGEAVLAPKRGRVADVYAYAKRDLAPGDVVHHSIGDDTGYGLVDRCAVADPLGRVPILLLEGHDGAYPRLKRAVPMDQPLTWDDLELPDSPLLGLWREQERMLGS